MSQPINSLLLASALVAFAAPALADGARTRVVDKSFDTAGAMFAYTEYELSGEPLAEALGLDLGILDPDRADKPTPFDFAAGIDSYETSEEAMYAVNYQSQLGPHLVNGPVNAKAGGSFASLDKRIATLADAVGLPADELPKNLYPITFPFAHGTAEFAQAIDTAPVATDQRTILTHGGKTKAITVVTPAYTGDYKTLAWRSGDADAAFVPAAVGAELLKDAMWSQDFLGGMHVTATDEEVSDVASADLDKDGTHALGVSAADGINGMLLTQITWDKLLTLRDRFGYDGQVLGAKIGPDYDPKAHPVWFPDRVAVEVTQKNGVKAIGGLKIVDGGSSLRNSWTMLWPLAELYGFTDQRDANSNQNKAFLAVFDGAPFPAAPAANREVDPAKHVAADDPFSLTETLSNLVFRNLDALHFDAKAGTFVDDWANGRKGDTVTSFDAAYTLVALGIYRRALDALPVGYASAASGKPLDTAKGNRALALLKAQADFIVAKLIGPDGLVADSYTIGKGAASGHGLATQFAAIRGLGAAFVATGDDRYRAAARKIYLGVEDHMFDPAMGLYNPHPGKAFTVTPWTAGAVAGGLRELLLTLHNREGESDPRLGRANLAKRYTAWFHTVARGLQLAEWPGDTGEYRTESGDGDVNDNGIKLPAEAGGPHGTAQVMAARIEVVPAD